MAILCIKLDKRCNRHITHGSRAQPDKSHQTIKNPTPWHDKHASNREKAKHKHRSRNLDASQTRFGTLEHAICA
jgi:hypothetical protein